jgi:hypothetical protein
MGSLISSTLAEIYLQYLEETYVKHCLENREITYYERYVGDILIIYDQNRTNEDTIHNIINNTDEQLEFKVSGEENRIINYLDLGIYRKPTWTSQYTSPPITHSIISWQLSNTTLTE